MSFDSPSSSEGRFSLPLRVYIEDTDAGGIVFYANYLKYFERARTELFRSLGFQLRDGFKDQVSYVVHSLELKYHKPCLLDESLIATARIDKVGASYLEFEQTVEAAEGSGVSKSANDVRVSGRVRVACVNLTTMKPQRLPVALLEALKNKR